jgi:hypothetical protein
MIFRDGRGFVMNDTAQFVSNLNVARFLGMLRVETAPATRASLHTLLLEEFNNLGFNLKQLGFVQRQSLKVRLDLRCR